MKIIKYTICGALIGLCIGLVLSFFVGCRSIASCSGTWLDAFFGCGDATCSGGCQQYTNNPNVRNCFIFSTIGCAVIGAAYGTFSVLQDKKAAQKAAELAQSKSIKEQQMAWAAEVKKSAQKLNETCFENQTSDKPLVSTLYQTNIQMEQIIETLTKVAEAEGKINFIVDDLSEEGGSSL